MLCARRLTCSAVQAALFELSGEGVSMYSVSDGVEQRELAYTCSISGSFGSHGCFALESLFSPAATLKASDWLTDVK